MSFVVTKFLCRATTIRLVSVLALWTMSDPVVAQEMRVNRVVWSAGEVSIAAYARTNAACEGIEPPTLLLDKPPEHGTVMLALR